MIGIIILRTITEAVVATVTVVIVKTEVKVKAVMYKDDGVMNSRGRDTS